MLPRRLWADSRQVPKMERRWKVRSTDVKLQNELAISLDISPVSAQLLINRGIKTKEAAGTFLACNLDSLYNPFLLKDMEKAVDRIGQVVSKNEKILVYGDYDVDGVTATALLVSAVRQLGGDVTYRIPHRIREGYGFSDNVINEILELGISLVITVDCGIGEFDKIDYLKEKGVDVIITDHHSIISDTLPNAYAVIDPERSDCSYPDKDLAGVGIAFKLACALLGTKTALSKYLDLVCLGTISDIVPLRRENRILVKKGLGALTDTKRVGLRALCEVAGVKRGHLDARDVGYLLGPRLNAAGRLGSADRAVELLLTTSKIQAAEIARSLDEENRKRQTLGAEVLKDAIQEVEEKIDFKTQRVIVLDRESWHPGVIGIVASRLVDRFYRPTILIAIKEGIGRGSGRSIDGFHLMQALESLEGLLESFGGHKYAAGFYISEKNIPQFREELNRLAIERLTTLDLMPTLNIDMEIPLNMLNRDIMREIRELEPFGSLNPRPLFLSSSVKAKGKPETMGRNGLKVWVTDKDITCEALTFKIAKSFSWDQLQKKSLSLVYFPTIKAFHGTESIQLWLEDIKLTSK